jgi:hypothetical protein
MGIKNNEQRIPESKALNFHPDDAKSNAMTLKCKYVMLYF